jgi:hypothetical protein
LQKFDRRDVDLTAASQMEVPEDSVVLKGFSRGKLLQDLKKDESVFVKFYSRFSEVKDSKFGYRFYLSLTKKYFEL